MDCPFDPKADLIETLSWKPLIIRKNDGTYRIYKEPPVLPDSWTTHFAVGQVNDRLKEEVIAEAKELISKPNVQLYHENGTLHAH